MARVRITYRYPAIGSLYQMYNQTGTLVALIEFLNKLQEDSNLNVPLAQRINPRGFTRDDEKRLEQRAESLVPILEGFQSFHREILTIQGQRAIDGVRSAISSVNQSSWHLKDILHQAMEAATKLTNADCSNLWIVARDRIYREIVNNQVGVVLQSVQQQDRLRHELSGTLSNATPPPGIH